VLLPTIELYTQFKISKYNTLSEFMKISGKYNNDEDFLKNTLKIFLEFKEGFNNKYRNFLEITVPNDNISIWK